MPTFKAKMRELLSSRGLTKAAMAQFVNSKAPTGFRAMLTKRHDEAGTEVDASVPQSIHVADSTVLRWMKLSDAVYGHHVKGFSDRRNDADIVDEVREYGFEMTELQKRMELWLKAPLTGEVVIADRLRCDDRSIEEGTRFDFETFYKLSESQPPERCKYNHAEGRCRCQLPIIHWGHDEAVFWANSLSSMEWTIDGERNLRPKNPGRGIMVSAFVCEKRGFGIHVTKDEWALLEPIFADVVDEHPWFRIPEPSADGDRQIGIVLFDYGSNKPKDDSGEDDDLKTGWWNCAKFRIQCNFVMRCFNALYGDSYQLMVQVDRSSGHMNRGHDALSPNGLGFNDGGFSGQTMKTGIRDTSVHEEDFGIWLKNSEERRPGMIDPNNPVQYGHYPSVSDTEERYDSVGPRYNPVSPGQESIDITIPEVWTKGASLVVTHHDIDIGGGRKLKTIFTPPTGSKIGQKIKYNLNERGKEWWRGMRKGQAQLLFETGWIDPSLKDPKLQWTKGWGKHKPSEEELKTKQNKATGKWNASLHLAHRRDFREERTLIEKLFAAEGHIAVASPRYHPELAGNGIEYCWGKAKWCFRRQINNLVSKDLEKNVVIALGDSPFKAHGTGEVCDAPLPVSRVRKFARRARTYGLLFQHFPSAKDGEAARQAWVTKGGKVFIVANGKDIPIGPVSKEKSFYSMIDRMYHVLKTHGNLIDMEFKFCVDAGTDTA